MSTTVVSASGNSSSRQVLPAAPLQVSGVSLPSDVVARIVVRLASRYQLREILNFSGVNIGFREALQTWRSAIGDGVQIGEGQAPQVLAHCAQWPQWTEDFEKQLASCCRRWTGRLLPIEEASSEPGKVGPDLYPNLPNAQRLLAFAALCRWQPELAAKLRPLPMDLMLLHLCATVKLQLDTAIEQFDQLAHVSLLSYLHQRRRAGFRQALEQGNFAYFAKVLVRGLQELPQGTGKTAYQLMRVMLRLKRDIGEGPIAYNDEPYLELMNAILTNLHRLDSGPEQAEILDLWIERCPEWTLPRLMLALNALCQTDPDLDRISKQDPGWQNDYCALQRLLNGLVSLHWKADADKRKTFLASLAEWLRIPENHIDGFHGMDDSDEKAFEMHKQKLRAWRKAHDQRDGLFLPDDKENCATS